MTGEDEQDMMVRERSAYRRHRSLPPHEVGFAAEAAVRHRAVGVCFGRPVCHSQVGYVGERLTTCKRTTR